MNEHRARCSRCGQAVGATNVTCPACGAPLCEEEDTLQHVRTLLRQKQYSHAISILSRWLELHPDDGQAWEMLAAAYFALEMFTLADEAAAKVVSLKPDSARAWCNWGTLLRKLGRFEDAKHAQLRCLQIDPNYSRARSELRKISRMKQEQVASQPTDLTPIADAQASNGQEAGWAVDSSAPGLDEPTFEAPDAVGAMPGPRRRSPAAMLGALAVITLAASGLVAVGVVKHRPAAPSADPSASLSGQPVPPAYPVQPFSPRGTSPAIRPSSPQPAPIPVQPPMVPAPAQAQPLEPTQPYTPEQQYPIGAAAASPSNAAPANPPGPAISSETAVAYRETEARGIIRGTVTFYFNNNFRTQPDTGSKVFVLPGDWSSWPFASMSVKERLWAESQSYARTIGDGNGNYSVEVPAGTWTVVLYSAHTTGSSDAEALHKIYQKTVDVAPGETVDVSHDFGISWF